MPNPPAVKAREGFDQAKHDFEAALDARLRKIKGTVLSEYLDKLFLLAKHYEIDLKPIDDWQKWMEFTFAIAIDHVEGFQVEEASKVGRKSKWNDDVRAKLYFDVENIKNNYPAKLSNTRACEILLKSETWREFVDQKRDTYSSAAYLAKEYGKAKKSLPVQTYLNLKEMGMCTPEVHEQIIQAVNKKFLQK